MTRLAASEGCTPSKYTKSLALRHNPAVAGLQSLLLKVSASPLSLSTHPLRPLPYSLIVAGRQPSGGRDGTAVSIQQVPPIGWVIRANPLVWWGGVAYVRARLGERVHQGAETIVVHDKEPIVTGTMATSIVRNIHAVDFTIGDDEEITIAERKPWH
uniref:Uncharacterized protein n=1 Tax=Oryza rufipogon TaxID=4529 RepID=A0A0E0PTK0_ORYRU